MNKNYQLSTRPVRKGSLILISSFLFAACMQHDESLAPRNHHTDLLSGEISTEASEQSMMMKHTFTAHLTGENEVPANDSQAQGQVIFKLNEDGTELHYKLIVANIENVEAAHIHCGAAGENGPAVVPLFGTATVGVYNGVLVEGVIADANVLIRPCTGEKSLDAVLELIRSGEAYVNVHTSQVPGGEIRGQIK